MTRRPPTTTERARRNRRTYERRRGITRGTSSSMSVGQLENQRLVDAIRAVLGLGPLYGRDQGDLGWDAWPRR